MNLFEELAKSAIGYIAVGVTSAIAAYVVAALTRLSKKEFNEYVMKQEQLRIKDEEFRKDITNKLNEELGKLATKISEQTLQVGIKLATLEERVTNGFQLLERTIRHEHDR